MGIAGAGIAGIAADCLKVGILFLLFLRATNRRRYGTLSGCVYDSGITRNLLRFGMGNGIQLLLTIAARLKSRLAAGDRVKSLERIFKKQTPTAFFENLPLAIFLVRDDDPTF